MKTIIKLLTATVVLFILVSGFVADTDTEIYKSVKIGSQEWMAENLNTSTFRNGDQIPQAISLEEWTTAGKE